MIIVVGSKNNVKISAVKEVIESYPKWSSSLIHSVEVNSEVSDQPLSLEEIVRGAKNRAKAAFKAREDANLGFGLESGLFEAKGSDSGFLEACICSIFDGERYFVGLSCGFEVPKKVLDLVLTKGMNLNDAAFASGFTSNKSLGTCQGMIGCLTDGRIDRKEYSKQAVVTAFMQIENLSWYSL